jgi:hypothetical protein
VAGEDERQCWLGWMSFIYRLFVRGLQWLNSSVPKKKKLKRFRATSAVKAASRAILGTPPPVKRAENKKRAKKDKHKPSLGKLLADADRG